MLFLKEHITWLINNSHSSIATALCQPSFRKLPDLVHRVKYLDRVQICRSVVSAYHIEHIVDHHCCCIATRSVHIGHAEPFPGAGVVALDTSTNIGAIVTPDGIEEVVHDSYGSSAPTLEHGLYVGPLVVARVVAFHGVEALASHAVVATHCKQVAVHHSHTYTGSTRCHGSNVHPLLGICTEKVDKLDEQKIIFDEQPIVNTILNMPPYNVMYM